jgi:N-acetylglucosamine kinase-like BadF-type ATPase
MDGSTVLAFDGGNSKTDLLLVSGDGELLGSARAAPFRPHIDGEAAALGALQPDVEALLERAGLRRATHAAASLANADRPDEERAFEAGILARGWASTASVVNDTLAVLRAGTAAGVGIAVVCGAGINCVGVDEGSATVRFPALGPLTGDWGGGHGLAEQVMWWSVRSEDGRGPSTALAQAVAERLGSRSATEAAMAFHFGDLAGSRLHELVPLLFEVAEGGDRVARAIVTQQADEIVTMVRVCIERLDFGGPEISVVLGGGVLAARQALLLEPVVEGLLRVSSRCVPEVLMAPPVVGAALAGLDHLADPDRLGRGRHQEPAPAEARLRASFPHPVPLTAPEASSTPLNRP